jgi:4-amino-4-deoxy-L-arabinose transferase-like glycosyltransferase
MITTRPNTALMIALLLSLTFFMQAFLGSRNVSLTWDEPSYIASGYNYLTTYDFRFNPSHPPLMKTLVAVPLLFMDIKATQPNQAELTAKNPQAEFGYRFIYGNGNDPRTIARWCRLPSMLIGAGLVLVVFFWGRELYGDGPALFGATLTAFCPNLLAQAKLATEDIGCAAFVFVSMWLFWKCLNVPGRKYACLCGIVTGLALLSKYTSLLVVPGYLLLVFVQCRYGEKKDSPREYLAKTAMVFLISVVIVAAAYGGNPLQYLAGIKKIYTDLNVMPTWYFFGESSTDTRWYYYIVSFLIKTPLPSLLAIFTAGALAAASVRYRRHLFVLLVPVALIIGVSCFDKGNFGLRRILPALPFLYLFAARFLTGENRITRSLSLLLVFWLMVELALIYPHHISYFNNAVGGPERGPYLLVGDDSDIGQDLPALAVWQKSHPEAGSIRLVYNGTADPAAYGVTATRVAFSEIDNPLPATYAISVTALVRTPWFHDAKPVARAGYSLYIYQF